MTNEAAVTVPLNIVCDLDGRRHPRNLQELAEVLDEVLYMKRVVASEFSSEGFGYRIDDEPKVGYYGITNHVRAEVHDGRLSSIHVPVGVGFVLGNRPRTIDSMVYHPKVAIRGDHITLLSLPTVTKGEWLNSEEVVYARAMTITVLRDL